MFNKFVKSNKQNSNILELNDIIKNIEYISIDQQKVKEHITTNNIQTENVLYNYESLKTELKLTDE